MTGRLSGNPHGNVDVFFYGVVENEIKVQIQLTKIVPVILYNSQPFVPYSLSI